jgi:hypothetical protein
VEDELGAREVAELGLEEHPCDDLADALGRDLLANLAAQGRDLAGMRISGAAHLSGGELAVLLTFRGGRSRHGEPPQVDFATGMVLRRCGRLHDRLYMIPIW